MASFDGAAVATSSQRIVGDAPQSMVVDEEGEGLVDAGEGPSITRDAARAQFREFIRTFRLGTEFVYRCVRAAAAAARRGRP